MGSVSAVHGFPASAGPSRIVTSRSNVRRTAVTSSPGRLRPLSDRGDRLSDPAVPPTSDPKNRRRRSDRAGRAAHSIEISRLRRSLPGQRGVVWGRPDGHARRNRLTAALPNGDGRAGATTPLPPSRRRRQRKPAARPDRAPPAERKRRPTAAPAGIRQVPGRATAAGSAGYRARRTRRTYLRAGAGICGHTGVASACRTAPPITCRTRATSAFWTEPAKRAAYQRCRTPAPVRRSDRGSSAAVCRTRIGVPARPGPNAALAVSAGPAARRTRHGTARSRPAAASRSEQQPENGSSPAENGQPVLEAKGGLSDGRQIGTCSPRLTNPGW